MVRSWKCLCNVTGRIWHWHNSPILLRGPLFCLNVLYACVNVSVCVTVYLHVCVHILCVRSVSVCHRAYVEFREQPQMSTLPLRLIWGRGSLLLDATHARSAGLVLLQVRPVCRRVYLPHYQGIGFPVQSRPDCGMCVNSSLMFAAARWSMVPGCHHLFANHPQRMSRYICSPATTNDSAVYVVCRSLCGCDLLSSGINIHLCFRRIISCSVKQEVVPWFPVGLQCSCPARVHEWSAPHILPRISCCPWCFVFYYMFIYLFILFGGVLM